MAEKKSRRKARSAVGALYRRPLFGDLSLCQYCGDKRESLDHVPPLAVAVDMDVDKFRKGGGELLLVPCCLICNQLLNAKLLMTLSERTHFLWERYAKEIDRMSDLWEEDEIAELGRGLQPMVRARQNKVAMYVRKLRGVEDRMLEMERDE